MNNPTKNSREKVVLEWNGVVLKSMKDLREQATHTTADVHEQDEAYLRRCRENAAFVTEYCGWTRIDCARNGVMRSREEIHDEVMDKLRDLL